MGHEARQNFLGVRSLRSAAKAGAAGAVVADVLDRFSIRAAPGSQKEATASANKEQIEV
ncbi:hypothetical protein [Streptomyces reniochalinae]|uniref:hypothetical protein n=1 Tax=Streptomyces reniochalinae TaxID=2250578 RepID=UPI0015F10722|nr:hypothetical protein [Streptomyces reniochalinae]